MSKYIIAFCSKQSNETKEMKQSIIEVQTKTQKLVLKIRYFDRLRYKAVQKSPQKLAFQGNYLGILTKIDEFFSSYKKYRNRLFQKEQKIVFLIRFQYKALQKFLQKSIAQGTYLVRSIEICSKLETTQKIVVYVKRLI